jgi:hypothetical protein
MRKGDKSDKKIIVEILLQSFVDNKSINYIIKQDDKRISRIRELIEYSFEVCRLFGSVFINKQRNACALVLYPDKKRVSFKSVLLDAGLIFSATGVGNIFKAMKREAAIKKQHPKELLYYLWFIGVNPAEQNKGIGSALLKELIADSLSQKRVLCLETSVERNLPWYKKNGLAVYKVLDFGYTLYCMKLA